MPDAVVVNLPAPTSLQLCPDCQQRAVMTRSSNGVRWFNCRQCEIDFGIAPRNPSDSDRRQELLDRFMHWFHHGFTIAELDSVLEACRWTSQFTSQGAPIEYSRADTWADCESRTTLLATMIERLEESKK